MAILTIPTSTTLALYQFTIELEGTRGVERDEAGQLQYVADSVAYLRQIGAFG